MSCRSVTGDTFRSEGRGRNQRFLPLPGGERAGAYAQTWRSLEGGRLARDCGRLAPQWFSGRARCPSDAGETPALHSAGPKFGVNGGSMRGVALGTPVLRQLAKNVA